MPRLGHSKSRRGCLKCKQRRVKCDENVPCSACARHGVECSLLKSSPAADSPVARHGARQRIRQIEPAPSSHGTEGPSPESSEISRSPPSADRIHSLDIFSQCRRDEDSRLVEASASPDLELMHHFTTVTYDSLPKGPGRQEFWQLSLPRLAFGYDFLLHQILAITGFHMADLYPERRSALSTRALQHQEKAFRGLCQAVPDLTGTNCHAIFATASLLTISAFAAFTENVAQEGHKPNIDNLMEAFSLIRGMNHILTRYEPILLDGPMGQLLQLGVSRHETPLLASTAVSLSKLVIPEDTDPVVRDICQHEVTKFIKFMEYPTSKAAYPELRAALSWPIVLSEEFVGLLHRRNAVALDILVYYCRILDHAGSCTWYMRGWGRCIHEDIATSRRANYGGHATTQTFA